jgi:hypothetical protein
MPVFGILTEMYLFVLYCFAAIFSLPQGLTVGPLELYTLYFFNRNGRQALDASVILQ